MSRIKLRDQREPGWFWAENELFDVFQPYIGPHGILTYMALARLSRGNEITISLRGIAEATGLSKDSVHRAMDALVEMKMVGQKVGSNRLPSTFTLYNLKQLAKEVGENKIQRLPQRRSVSGGDITGSGKPSGKAVDKSSETPNSASPTETLMSPVETVMSQGKDTYLKQDLKLKTTTPPPPFQGGKRKGSRDHEAKHSTPKPTRSSRGDTRRTSPAPGSMEPRPATSEARDSESLAPSGFSDFLPQKRPSASEVPNSLAGWRVAFHSVLRDLKDYLYKQDDSVGPNPPKGFENGYDLWKRCFDDLEVSDFDADETSLEPRITLVSDTPAAANSGLTKFSKFIQRSIMKHIGTEVQIKILKRA